jgi:hypothetical protein
MPPGPASEPDAPHEPHEPHAAPDNLLLLAHGRADVITQARFCLLTFQHFALRAPGRYRVVVYTDQPAAFADLGENVRTEPLTPETLRGWRGPQDYVHRVKPEMLLHFAGAYDGRLLFVDSDTYFIRDPAELFDRVRPGVAALHLDEGRLSERRNGNARRLHDFVRRTELRLPDGTVGRLPEDTAMWNSGVVGIAPEDRDLLAPSLALVDELYGRYEKHNMEQLALSYVLARRLRLVPADDVVCHYWGRGMAFDLAAVRFFAAHADDDLATLAAAAFALAPEPERDPRKPWYHKLIPRALR